MKEGDIRKVAIGGGPAVTIGTARNVTNFTWEPDGTIVFSTVQGLYRMPESGGAAHSLVEGVKGRIQSFQMLPDRNSLLYTLRPEGTINPAETQIIVRSLGDGSETIVARGGIEARYLPTGHLAYFSNGSILTVRFDLSRLTVTSAPEPAADGVMTGAAPGIPIAAAHLAISPVGTLAYGRGDPRVTNARGLVWVDRMGREEALEFPAQPYVYPRLSPDERSIGITVRQQGGSDVFVLDIARKSSRPFASDLADERYSTWTPDNKRLYFGSQRNNEPSAWWQAADGSGRAQRLVGFPRTQFSNFVPTSISPDGAVLLATAIGPSGADLWTVALTDTPTAKPLLDGPATERNGEISPDGRWVAYESVGNGEMNVFVRPFPNVNDGQWAVSTGGGTQPRWARDGKELFYLDALNMLTAVSVEAASTFVSGKPVRLLQRAYAASIPTYAGRQYDVTRDGKRFLMMKDAAIGSQAQAPNITIVQNWFEELRRR